MTPKQRVLRKYPHALLSKYPNGLCVIGNGNATNGILAAEFSARKAWADAARRVQRHAALESGSAKEER